MPSINAMLRRVRHWHSVDFVGVGPGFQDVGREGAIACIRMFTDAFTEMQVKFENPFADGPKVVVQCVGTGVHTGEFQGNAPTGRPISFHCIVIMRVTNGEIDQAWFRF